MGESLWLAVCPRRGLMAPFIVSRRVDDDGLQAFASAIAAFEPDVVEVWLYPLASEKTVTFAGLGLHRLVEEHKERAAPAAVVGVPGPVAVGFAETKPVVLVAPPAMIDRGCTEEGGLMFRNVRAGDMMPDRGGQLDAQYWPRVLRWFCPSLTEEESQRLYQRAPKGALVTREFLKALVLDNIAELRASP